jgi:hypothetical protein
VLFLAQAVVVRFYSFIADGGVFDRRDIKIGRSIQI